MKKTKRLTVASVVAVISGIVIFQVLGLQASMCFYAGDGQVNFQELRDACYDSYPAELWALEALVLAVVVFFLLNYILTKVGNKKTNSTAQ